MNARTEALAFRIWCYCEPIGWDCTHGEVAEALGTSYQRVSGICRRKGWDYRLRTPVRSFTGRYADLRVKHDSILESWA